MKIKPILLICSSVVTFFGLGYIFFPAKTLAWLGYETNSTGQLAIQFVGVLSMGYAANLFAIRNAKKDVQKPAILSACIAMGFAFLVSLINQLAGTFGALGWIGVGMFCLAFVVFGYFWFTKMQR